MAEKAGRDAVPAIEPRATLEASVWELSPTAEAWQPIPDHMFRAQPLEAFRSHQQPSPAPTEADCSPRRPGKHYFLHFSCMSVRKCRWCWQPVKLLRGACKCQHCGIIVHKICQRIVSQSCGILLDLWTHYTLLRQDLNSLTPILDVQNIACWVYRHLLEQRELRYLTFKNKTVQLYTEVPTDNTKIEELYPLGIPEVHANLGTDVSGRFRGSNLDKFISINYYTNKQSGIPSMTFMLEFHNDWDREIFIDAFYVQMPH